MNTHDFLNSEKPLTEEQLQLVHSDEFKQWFGDWQGSPLAASKIIDHKTGTPLLVYHGAREKFDKFDKQFIKDGGIFCTPVKGIADTYTGRYGELKELFVNAKRVIDLTDPESEDNEINRFINAYKKRHRRWVDRRTGQKEDVRHFLYGQLFDYEGDWSTERWRDLMYFAEDSGYDAVLALDHNSSYANSMSIIVFDPENIRSVSSFAQVRESILLFEQFVARKR